MFVLSQQDNALFRVIAMLVAIALVLWGVGLHINTARAANLTDIYDLLSESNPGDPSNHTIEFVVPAGSNGVDADNEQIIITFPAGFNVSTSGVWYGDVDLAIDGVDQTIATTSSSGVWGFSVSSQDLILETTDDFIGAGATVTIEIGTNASFGVTGTNQVTNPPLPSASGEEFVVTLPDDIGKTRVVIVDNVLVTAQVDTIFNFTVSGFSSAGIAVNGTSTTGTSSATALPFGTLANGNIETLAQLLNVSTNAINGFVVTGEVDHQLLSSTGADIDAFANAVFADPNTWSSPSNLVTQENTWGHWGWTSEDTTTPRAAINEFGSNEWEGASTSPAILFAHTGPADGTTPGVGSTTVGFQAEITALQEAADDYEATLTYIATPTF